jgi:ectoine hydroxylase-related dioxygenase (phytanoyl-CoA dioxygenase family)
MNMLTAIKAFVRQRIPGEPPRAPDAAGFAARGRRWDAAKVEPPWFERDGALSRAGEMARRHGLGGEGEAWLRQWIEEGYFVVERAVDADKVARYADDFERLWWLDRPIPGLSISDVTIAGKYHVHIPHAALLAYSEAERREACLASNWRVGEFYQSSKAAEAVYRDERLRRICSAVLGEPAVPHFSLSFSKGSQQGLHQDTCVFHVWPRNALVGVWIAAEKIAADSGPLEYYPGSHREPLFPPFTNYPQTQRRTAPAEIAGDYDQYVRDIAAKYPRETYLPEAGDALFWHGMLIHGSAAVQNPARTRKSMVIHFLPEGANRGHQVEGPFNW